jgi:amidase
MPPKAGCQGQSFDEKGIAKTDTRDRRTQNYIVLPVAGPLTTSLSTVELYFESLLDSQPWNVDPGLLPIPWSYEVAKKPKRRLKLAFIVDDGIIKPQPPVERITRKTAEKLRAAGHEGMFSGSPS